MPKIPTYMASIDDQLARGDIAAAGAPGRALAKFGETALQVVSGHADRINKAEQARRKATAETERAGGTARGLKSLSQTYAAFRDDSDPGSVMDRWRDATEAAGQEILSAIRNPETRAQVETDYKSMADVQATVLRGESLRRLAEQGRNDLAGNLDLYAETAAAARHPLQHDDAVGLALREIANKVAAGFITAEDGNQYEQGFYSNIAERQARDAIAFDPEDTLARLNDGADFGGLAEDARARQTVEASRAVQAQAARRESEAAAARRETLTTLPGFLESLRDGALPEDSRFTRDQVFATLGEEAGGKTWAEIEQATALGDAMAAIRWATPGEIAERMSGLETDAAQPKAAGLLALALARREQQVRDKPADYARANPHIAELHGAMVQAMAQLVLPPAVSAAMQAGGNTAAPFAADLSQDDRRATIAAYANATLAEQKRLGVPEAGRQVLPEAMAKEMVTGILGGDPAKADQTLRDLAKDWGDEWPRVLADLQRAGLPPEYAELAARNDPAARQTLAEVLTIQTNEPGALRAQIAADADGIDELVHRHRASPAGQFLSDDRVKLVKLLAYRYARFSEPEEAMRRAVADMSGDGIAPLGHDMGDVPRDSRNSGSNFVKIAASSDQENPVYAKAFPGQSVLAGDEMQIAQAESNQPNMSRNRRIARVVPPRKPISAQELQRIKGTVPKAPPGVDIDANIADALRYKGNDFWFKNQVTNRGPWDYKRQARAFADFGNFNYGATGAAIGYTEDILLRMAGWKQVDDKNSDPAWGVAPSMIEALLGIGGVAPFGDDPKDQDQIILGYKYFHTLHPKGR